MLRNILRCAALLWAAAFATWAVAQPYPTQPIRIVVAFTPGTSMDIIARVVGQKLGERMGQPVVVENKAGASGIIGTSEVARAAPDGYTLTVTGFNVLIAPKLYPSAPFEALGDFTPITMAAKGTLMLVANPKFKIDTYQELVSRAKAQPGKLFYSSPGVGTSHHMSMELLKNQAGIDLTHVPYKGSAGALNDLMGGDISVGFVPVSVALPLVTAGKLKALAVGSPQRYPGAQQVPTLKELGIKNADIDMWYAFLGPKNMPAAIVDTLNRQLRDVLALPDVQATLHNQGLETEPSTPAALKSFMSREDKRWGDIIKVNHITAG
jgi:tripartite-type tricarboxylate transporter receptor subunit TctC